MQKKIKILIYCRIGEQLSRNLLDYLVDQLKVSVILGVGKNAAYQLVAENKFKSVRIGSSIRISKESFDKWLNENL